MSNEYKRPKYYGESELAMQHFYVKFSRTEALIAYSEKNHMVLMTNVKLKEKKKKIFLCTSFTFLPYTLTPFQSESQGKVVIRYLREPFSALLLLLHAVRKQCATLPVCVAAQVFAVKVKT